MTVSTPHPPIHDWFNDAARWDHYKARAGDVIISTAPKSGTTWMQQIVGSLVFQSAEPIVLQRSSPNIAGRLSPVENMAQMIEGQEHRRFLKGHQAFYQLPWSPDVRYIHVGRDGRDVAMSYHNHCLGYSPVILEMGDKIGLADPRLARPYPRPPADARQFFLDWLADNPDTIDGYPARSMFEIERSFWAVRDRPNVFLTHYNDLKADLEGEMRRIAAFLDIDIPEALWPQLVDAARFETMKSRAGETMPMVKFLLNEGPDGFFYKGTNERWREVLTPGDSAAYEARAAAELEPDLARWLAHGGRLSRA